MWVFSVGGGGCLNQILVSVLNNHRNFEFDQNRQRPKKNLIFLFFISICYGIVDEENLSQYFTQFLW